MIRPGGWVYPVAKAQKINQLIYFPNKQSAHIFLNHIFFVMEKIYRVLTMGLVTASMLFGASGAQAEISERVAVFGGGNTAEPNEYRIPTLGYDGDETLIAFVDDRGDNGSDIGVNGGTAHILYKISKDNGATWSDAHRLAPAGFTRQHGDAAVAYDAKNGRFVVLFVGDQSWSTGERGTIWMTYSTNSDYTAWSEPKDVTDQFVASNYRAFTSSGTMMYKDGEIYVVLCKSTYNSSWVNYAFRFYISNVVYKSADGGETWTKVSGEYEKGDESHVVAMSDGDMILSRRKNGNGSGYKNRNFWKSTNDGASFTALPTTIEESGCNGDLLVYEKDGKEWLLQSLNLNRSNDDYTNRPLVICASSDEGGRWAQTPKIDDGEYSCMTILENGKIGIYYEQNNGTQFSTYFRTLDLEDAIPTSTATTFEGYLNTNKLNYLNISKEDAQKLAEVKDNGVWTVTARVLCGEFEKGSNAVERGIMSTRTEATYKGGITGNHDYHTYGGFQMYGGNANNPFGINVSVNQEGSYFSSSAHNWVLANHPYTKFYETDKDKWTHVTLVFDPKNQICYSYINGQLFEKQGFTGDEANKGGVGVQYDKSFERAYATGKGITVYDIMTIGTHYKDPKYIWQGGIDDVRFYDKALTQAEIEADIKSGFPLFTGNNSYMRGAFDFSAKDGNDMYDITGKNIKATAANPNDYKFPETDQNATQVNVTVVDREGNPIAVTDAYTLNRYIGGKLDPQANGAKASVNTDFMITAKKVITVNKEDYTLYAIFVNDKEVDPFDFSVTDFGVSNEVSGGYFKSAKAVNDVKVVYNYKEETPAFKLVGENISHVGDVEIASPYEYPFEYQNGVYTLKIDTENYPEFEIIYYDSNGIEKVRKTMSGVFHVEEYFPEVAATQADNDEAVREATAARSFYAHEVHRAEPGHTSVKMLNDKVFSMQNVDNQSTPIHFTTNHPANPRMPETGFNNPVFTMTFTPTGRTLAVHYDEENGGSTGVEEVAVDNNDAPVEIYTLSGIRVPKENLTPGFYIRRQGHKATKILVR